MILHYLDWVLRDICKDLQFQNYDLRIVEIIIRKS
jgi:hypothetical protein